MKRKGRPEKDAHPWKKVGVQPKRYRADISAEAAAKRGQVQAKAAEDQRRKVAEKAGEERLGRMMDGKSRMTSEVDEADTVSDEDANATQMQKLCTMRNQEATDVRQRNCVC